MKTLYLKGYKWLVSQNQQLRIDFRDYRRYNALAKHIKPFFKKMLKWIDVSARTNTFFRLNLVFIADSHTGFFSELFWKRVKPAKEPLELFRRKGVLRNIANFTGKQLCWSLLLIEFQALRSRSALFNNLPFWLKLIHRL